MSSRAPSGLLGAQFEALYRDHFAFVWRMLTHFGVPEHQLEDAAQDVFIVAHRRFAQLDLASPRPWLYGVARRVAATARRSRARRERKIAALAAPEARALEGQLADRELLAALDGVLAELEPSQREVFVMAEVEGMSAREIGEVLDVNPNTVYSRLRKARDRVARGLRQIEGCGRDPRRRDGTAR